MAFLASNMPAGNSKTPSAMISNRTTEAHNNEEHAPKEQDDGGHKDNGIMSTQSSTGSSVLKVYTDGSCLGNGKPGSSAGIGVFFGHGDKRNISERLKGEPQTNQRAELTAIIRALEVTPNEQPLQIVSDSKYAINCVTEWYKKWLANGWKTKKGDVINQDLIKAVRTFVDMRKEASTSTTFDWVEGHSTDQGNIAADILANRGAQLQL